MGNVKNHCEMIKSSGKQGTNKRGNVMHSMFMPSERYVIDFADDFKSEGWSQYDTNQDAHYFGVWVNPKTLQILTYAEGDWTLEECPDADHYNDQIKNMNDFYGEGFIAKSIDMEGNMTTLCQNRQDFFIK